MKRTRFTDEQIIGILAAHGRPMWWTAQSARTCVASTGCRKGPSITGKRSSGGMTVPEAKRLKAFEDENAKLKKLLAGQMLDLAAMKELVSKKW